MLPHKKQYLLLKDNQLYIEASGNATDNVVTVLPSITVENYQDLPLSVINYVFRTQQYLVLNDAITTEPFNLDIYIQESRNHLLLADNLPITAYRDYLFRKSLVIRRFCSRKNRNY